MIAKQRTRLTRPESVIASCCSSVAPFQRVTFVIDRRLHAEERTVAEPAFQLGSASSGVIMKSPVSVCHRIDHRTFLVADFFQYHSPRFC
ncbi:hypothetical protein [Klebsiella pneumoniae]|uniref:hypothetical protein n=1 Tax=Klebsiella pneumoniae TaxID=573 RepID=UPI0031FE5A22